MKFGNFLELFGFSRIYLKLGLEEARTSSLARIVRRI